MKSLHFIFSAAAFIVILAFPGFARAANIEMIGEVDVESSPGTIRSFSVGVAKPDEYSFPRRFSLEAGSDVLVFKNGKTGKTVGLKYDSAGKSLKVSPLLWKELSNNGLGVADSYTWSQGSITNDRVRMRAAWSSFAVDTNSLAKVKLPEFKFKKNGILESTGTTNRTLIAVSDNIPFKRTTVDGQCVDGSTDAAGKLSTYTYKLPDGRQSSLVSSGEPASIAPLSVTINSGTLPVTINYTDGANEGFNDPTSGAERRAAMEHAVAIWASTLFGTVPVVVEASIDPLSEGVLGQAGPISLGTSEPSDAEFDKVNTVYVSALANQLLGADFWPTDGDIQITYSSDFVDDFYFGLDGNVPPGKDFDFVTIVIHEMSHGLGFLDGMDSSGDFISDGDPFVYDHFLWRDGTYLINMDQTTRASALTSNALFWDGEKAKEANTGARIKMYAPSTYEPGSSIGHWDTSIPFLSFMEPRYFAAIHTIDPQLLGALRDMEWLTGFTYNGWVQVQNIPANQRGLLEDPAGDGIANIWKFAVGLDALTFHFKDDLYTYAIDQQNEEFSLTYKVAKFRPQATVETQYAGNLLFGGWDSNAVTTVKVGETADQETWKSTIPLQSQGYIRLQAEVTE